MSVLSVRLQAVFSQAATAGQVSPPAQGLPGGDRSDGLQVPDWAALVKTGKVEAERMDILSPKPVNPTAKGETRANLSLD